MSTDPGFVRAQITEAEKRAGARQVRLLIVALIGLGVIAAFAVAGLTKQVIAQNAQIKSLAEQLAGLAKAQADNSAQGRALIQKVVDLTSLIAGFTDPTSKAAMDQQAKTAAALRSLLAGQQIQSADVLRKLGEMAVALAPPDRMAEVQAAVAKILAEPAPPIVIPSVPAPSPTAKQSATVSPSPSVSPALNVQVQCLIACPTK